MALNTGRILRVNLSSGKISTESIPESIATDFIGGRGYGIKYLYDEEGNEYSPNLLTDEQCSVLLIVYNKGHNMS